MPYYVPLEVREELLRQPETGMGYQLVNVPNADGRNHEDSYVILNGELALKVQDSIFEGCRLHSEEQEFLDSHASELHKIEGTVTEALGVSKPFPHRAKNIIVRGGNSFSSTYEPGEFLVRYSAFRYDRRVTIGRKLSDTVILSGTYFTTGLDSTLARSGLAAVSRYALPNPAPAVFCTSLKWSRPIAITYGTVKPEFDQSGGGVEARIDSPAPSIGEFTQELLPEG